MAFLEVKNGQATVVQFLLHWDENLYIVFCGRLVASVVYVIMSA